MIIYSIYHKGVKNNKCYDKSFKTLTSAKKLAKELKELNNNNYWIEKQNLISVGNWPTIKKYEV